MILGTVGTSAADDAVDVEVSTFIPPKLLELKTPIYPEAALQEEIEAWVYLHFMVDAEGKVTDINVIDSIGGVEFETSAIAALRESTYAPATEVGVPVSASRVFKTKFEVGSSPREATSEFMSQMGKLLINAMQESPSVIRTELEELRTQARSLHEFSLLDTIEFIYYRRWGTLEGQLQVLRRGLAYESTSSFLSDDDIAKSLQIMFLFEVDLKYYQDALSTYKKLKRLRPDLDDICDACEAYHTKVLEIKQDRIPFTKTAKLDEAGRWNYALLWSEFSIELEKPIAKDLRVRCERESVTFKYEPDRLYSLPYSSRDCILFVEGTPNTPIRLHQL